MKYQFYGRKTEWVGKPLWKILGNLKNFGKGRMIVQSTLLKFPEPSFWRIVNVQPLDLPKEQFEDRDVMVWVEEVYKGRKVPDVILKTNNKRSDFILVPKIEEEKYLKLAEEYKTIDTREVIPKYVPCPPLFKQLWEAEYFRKNNKFKEIPKIKSVIKEDILGEIRLGEKDETIPQQSSDLYKQDVPVEDLIKEIARLQKIVNMKSQ